MFKRTPFELPTSTCKGFVKKVKDISTKIVEKTHFRKIRKYVDFEQKKQRQDEYNNITYVYRKNTFHEDKLIKIKDAIKRV